jgi:hypothetical protein
MVPKVGNKNKSSVVRHTIICIVVVVVIVIVVVVTAQDDHRRKWHMGFCSRQKKRKMDVLWFRLVFFYYFDQNCSCLRRTDVIRMTKTFPTLTEHWWSSLPPS